MWVPPSFLLRAWENRKVEGEHICSQLELRRFISFCLRYGYSGPSGLLTEQYYWNPYVYFLTSHQRHGSSIFRPLNLNSCPKFSGPQSQTELYPWPSSLKMAMWDFSVSIIRWANSLYKAPLTDTYVSMFYLYLPLIMFLW